MSSLLLSAGEGGAGTAPDSGGHGKGPPRKKTSDVLPHMQRRGAPAAYTWRSAQIDRNNAMAAQIAAAVAKALTAKT